MAVVWSRVAKTLMRVPCLHCFCRVSVANHAQGPSASAKHASVRTPSRSSGPDCGRPNPGGTGGSILSKDYGLIAITEDGRAVQHEYRTEAQVAQAWGWQPR